MYRQPSESASMESQKLDEDQQKAVEHLEGPALVVAGPGSGKTTVIKERILNLIQSHNVNPKQILAIAFTNAAADEMEKRFSSEPTLKDSKPEICTLHVFGKEIITEHYELAGFTQEPNIWDSNDIEQIINKEKTRLNIENEEISVYIYKFEGNRSGRCYIGQTIDLKRREREHRTYSSNRGLREALAKDDEYFNCKEIKRVKGLNADKEEERQINFYKDRSVVNLALEMEHIGIKHPEIPITIYKIKLSTVVTSWIGMSTDIDPEVIKNEAFHRAIEAKGTKAHPEYVKVKEALSRAIENEVIKSASFEIIATVPGVNAIRRLKQEIDEHKKWAVFNREAPLQARESNKRQIEIFCQHFDISYDEVLKHTPRFRDLMAKFDSLKEDIENEKRQITTGVFDPNKIVDLIFRAFARRYESVKQKANAIDFLDMLIHSANLLENNQDILQDYREKHRYVHVDEFQDISPIDFRLINLFSENLFAVGDDDQAIYGFRGGDSSIMREKFGRRRNVTHYEITRNYRSTSTIVRHAKALIEHNPERERIRKNLRAKSSAQNQVKIFKTPQKTATVNEVLLRELSNLFTTDLKNVGILARNWKGEINDIEEILDFSELKTQGFEIDWEELGDPGEKNRKKMILRRGTKEIEILNIYAAKGREWEKVIFLVNTVYDNLPDDRNDLAEERRLFYVAVTRAKQELVVLNGGNCQFISEFQNAPPTKEELEEIFKAELAAREPRLKKELEEVSKAALATLKSKSEKEIEKASKAARKQHEPDISHLQWVVAEAENAKQNVQNQIKERLPQQLITSHNALFEELIPVLDTFESQLNSMQTTVESNDIPADLVRLTESFRRAHVQLLDSVKNHGLKPIEAVSNIFNPTYHEKVSSDIYSSEVPTGRIAKEEQRGYVLHDQVLRKAQVVISKREQRADVFLCQAFGQPVRFVTYTGFRDLKNIKTFKDGVKGLDSQDKEVQLQSLNVLFAFPKEDMKALKPCIKKYPVIANQNLQPMALTSERFHIADNILKQLLTGHDAIELEIQDPTVQLTTRSGHVLNGHLWDFDEDFLYMNINKKDVVVYRSGILKFVNLIWNEINRAYKNDTPINGYIIERIRGGFQVKFKSLTGFLPASQIELQKVQNLDSYVGKNLEMKVIEIRKPRNDIIFSRRAWLEDRKIKTLNTLKTGQQETGVVKNITNYGAFVNLGGIDGLLHKSEMTWKRINHPSEVVSVGEEIEVKIIEFDREKENIVLSLKQMTSDPWENVEDKYPIGSIVRGVVVNIVNYGAFVQLEDGVEGLIHVSEMSWTQHNPEPWRIVNKGTEVEAMILEISKDSRRISLSIKQCQQNSFETEEMEPSTDKPTPMLEIESERSNESPKLRVIKQMNKTVEAIPGTNESSLAPENQRILLDKSISVIVPEPVEKVVDTPPSMPKDSLEIFDTCVREFKPEILEAKKTGHIPLYEPIDLIVPEPIKKVVDSRLPTPKNSLEIPNSQIQNLTPDTPRIEIVLALLETVNGNRSSTLHGYEDILKKQIQEIKTDTLEPDITSYPPIGVNNRTQETAQGHKDTLKKQIQEIKTDISEPENPVESTALTRSDSPTEINSGTHQIKGQNSSENAVEDTKKSLGYYLRRVSRFAAEKIKTTIFKKQNS